MYEDYLKEVLAAYEKKKEDPSFSSNLLYPTPASLRNECLIVYRERPLSSDNEILRLFFTATDKEKGYTKSIENFSITGFKQLPKILRGEVSNPKVMFIELIAWLIDFKPRPSTLYYKSTRDNAIINPIVLSPVKEQEPTDEILIIDNTKQDDKKTEKAKDIAVTTDVNTIPKRINNKNTQKSIIITCITFLVVGFTAFLSWEHFTGTTRTPSQDENCMYWTGNHYEPINCNEQAGYLPIVPLDTNKLKHLKKINWPDRLTKDALGRIWYSSVGGEYEFFTDSGMHPVDTVKRLRPLTTYIIANHISYHRYLLTILVWAICTIMLFILSVLSLNYFRRMSKRQVKQS